MKRVSLETIIISRFFTNQIKSQKKSLRDTHKITNNNVLKNKKQARDFKRKPEGQNRLS
jgi:hypothetical protein